MWVIIPYANSLIMLITLGIAVFVPLILFYFFMLFFLTKGMKYFVARKPAIYRIISKLQL
jgi:hypothetical protein